MLWAILRPLVVVLFDALIFMVAISITRDAAHEHDREWQLPGATTPEGAATEDTTVIEPAVVPGINPSHAA